MYSTQLSCAEEEFAGTRVARIAERDCMNVLEALASASRPEAGGALRLKKTADASGACHCAILTSHKIELLEGSKGEGSYNGTQACAYTGLLQQYCMKMFRITRTRDLQDTRVQGTAANVILQQVMELTAHQVNMIKHVAT